MITSATIYHFLQALNLTIDVRNVCVFLAPLFSSFTTIVTYLLTSELHSKGAGLVAASMIAIVPGYISRSVAGSYDNEGIAIFCMLLTYYFYMVSSWGGYVFLINLIPLHVFTLMVCGRFNHKVMLPILRCILLELSFPCKYH